MLLACLPSLVVCTHQTLSRTARGTPSTRKRRQGYFTCHNAPYELWGLPQRCMPRQRIAVPLSGQRLYAHLLLRYSITGAILYFWARSSAVSPP